MKKTLHWLDENLEEFLLVVMLAAMTLIMGIPDIFPLRAGTVSVLVRGGYPFSLYLERFFKRQLLQQKMPFYQDRTVRRRLPAQRKGSF